VRRLAQLGDTKDFTAGIELVSSTRAGRNVNSTVF